MNHRLTPDEIYFKLYQMFPHAEAELVHNNAYELSIAVMLSAQTTDIAVNKVTPALFEKFPSVYELALSSPQEIETYIKTLGLYRNKAKSMFNFAHEVIGNFNGEIPNTREELMTLSGIGRKSANVILSVIFNVPAIAVDTHVERVSKRLRLAYQNDSVLKVEQKLMRKFRKEYWNKLHHLLIFFGRYHCKSQAPLCETCPFTSFCYYYKHL
ncbi:MAG TPA: endonuclease III [Erysipelothrix sp.]|jgi:endonuclease-3|nr:endonuclease III [Erysipelothrix sp.]